MEETKVEIKPHPDQTPPPVPPQETPPPLKEPLPSPIKAVCGDTCPIPFSLPEAFELPPLPSCFAPQAAPIDVGELAMAMFGAFALGALTAGAIAFFSKRTVIDA